MLKLYNIQTKKYKDLQNKYKIGDFYYGKEIVVALGHSALGKTFPEQKKPLKPAASAIADLVEAKYDIVITHSNGFTGRHDSLCHEENTAVLNLQTLLLNVYMQRHEPRDT